MDAPDWRLAHEGAIERDEDEPVPGPQGDGDPRPLDVADGEREAEG